MSIVTKAFLREYFRYEDGKLIAIKTRKHSRVLVGDELGYYHTPTGRMRATLFGRKYGLSQLVWIYFNDELPEYGIDHEDRAPLNDRIENLRPCTASLNAQNVVCLTGKKKGVNKTYSGKWQAKIVIKGKPIYLGVYDDYESALAARVKAEKELFEYSPLNGGSANVNAAA